MKNKNPLYGKCVLYVQKHSLNQILFNILRSEEFGQNKNNNIYVWQLKELRNIHIVPFIVLLHHKSAAGCIVHGHYFETIMLEIALKYLLASMLLLTQLSPKCTHKLTDIRR